MSKEDFNISFAVSLFLEFSLKIEGSFVFANFVISISLFELIQITEISICKLFFINKDSNNLGKIPLVLRFL